MSGDQPTCSCPNVLEVFGVGLAFLGISDSISGLTDDTMVLCQPWINNNNHDDDDNIVTLLLPLFVCAYCCFILRRSPSTKAQDRVRASDLGDIVPGVKDFGNSSPGAQGFWDL